MVWIYKSNGPLQGEATIEVTNKRTGLIGRIGVEYYPATRFVGPVVDADPEANPSDPENVFDRRPTVRCVEA